MRTGCILAAKNRISKIRRKDLGVQQVSTLRKVRQKQIQNMFLYAKSSDSFWRYLRQIKSTSGDMITSRSYFSTWCEMFENVSPNGN